MAVSDALVGSVLHAVYSPSPHRSVGTAAVRSDCAARRDLLRDRRAGEGSTAVHTVSAPYLIATSFTTSME